MKSVKLTPIWMFVLLLAILIISVLIGSRANEEGFTTQTSYTETDLTGYANKVYPILAGSVYFDKANGNLVLQTDSKASAIVSRGGSESKVSSAVKLDSRLPKTITAASTSWSIPIGTNGQLYYMPFGKTTFIQVFSGDTVSAFCFRDSDVFTGNYDPFNVTMLNSDKNMLYETLIPVTDNKLTSNKLFKTQLFGIKEAGLFYDIGSGSVVIPKTADAVDIISRDGARLDDAAINKLKITADGPTKNMIDFNLDTKYKLNQNAEFKPWYMFIGSGDAIKTALSNEAAAKKAADDATNSLAEVKAKQGVTAAEIATAQKALDDANKKVSDAIVAKFKFAKTVFVMPYKAETVVATFEQSKLLSVMRFNKDGYVVPVPMIENILSKKPSAESAISEYYKWYWYWKKTGAGTMTDDYMLKTQIVPPVCPTCPSVTCAGSKAVARGAVPGAAARGAVPGAAARGAVPGAAAPGAAVPGTAARGTAAPAAAPGAATGGEKPISDAIKTTADLLKSFGSGAKDVGLGTVGLAKDAAKGTVGLAKETVGGTIGLAKETVGGTIGLAKDAVGGTIGLAKDTAGGAIGLTKDTIQGTANMARGSGNGGSSQSWAGRNQTSSGEYSYESNSKQAGPMDPYTYNGALKQKATSNFIPVTADFSAFSR